VMSGLYQYTRNPIYVSYSFALVGESILFGSTTLLLLALTFHVRNTLFIHLDEEPRLRKQFGAVYEDYCRRVPRWLPRFPRNSG